LHWIADKILTAENVIFSNLILRHLFFPRTLFQKTDAKNNMILLFKEGGTGQPLKHLGQNMIFSRTFDCMAATMYLDEKDRILPGENGMMKFIFRVPMVIEKGDRFTVRTGKTTVGTGVVTKVIDDVTEEQVKDWFDMKAHLKTTI
jgi:translation elongation factor EF-Tu-like GTPase